MHHDSRRVRRADTWYPYQGLPPTILYFPLSQGHCLARGWGVWLLMVLGNGAVGPGSWDPPLPCLCVTWGTVLTLSRSLEVFSALNSYLAHGEVRASVFRSCVPENPQCWKAVRLWDRKI